MITITNVSLLLAGAMLLTGLLMLSRVRLVPLFEMFRYQSLLLAVFAALMAINPLRPELLFIAVVVAAVKGVFIPEFVKFIAHADPSDQRLQTYVRPTTARFMGIIAVIGAAYAARFITLGSGTYPFVAISLSLIAIGIVLLITRLDMFGEAAGFLVLENGIYIFGLALTGGMPLFVEIGILFDLLILFVLVIALVRRARAEHSSTATDYLNTLTD